MLQHKPISILDLVPVYEGYTATESFQRSRNLAKLADELGYKRYWVAEHHNSRSIASSATAVVIGHLAEVTTQIRVGSGGIMLPNHAPLIIAEQFGTLEAMYPGRIDLGLGRAPGTDPFTARALRRRASEDFEQNIEELERFTSKAQPSDSIQAHPGAGANIPLWLLGSSPFSAELAGRKGMPYAFASHFAPDYFSQAIRLYRKHFQASDLLEKPYMIACVNAIVAPTDEEAQFLATTAQQFALNIIRQDHQLLQRPIENMDAVWSRFEKEAVLRQRHHSFIGSPETVRTHLETFIEDTQMDELMFVKTIYDEEKQHQSIRLLKEVFEK